jgi:hypothetical protein
VSPITDRTERELAALADGSLTGRRRRRLEAKLAASAELRDALERQRRAVAAVRSLEVRAPDALRARIEAEYARASGGRRAPAAGRVARSPLSRRLGLVSGLAGAAAAVLLALVLTLPGGAGGPSVVEAAELSERPPTEPAPQPAGPKLLDAGAAGLPFPDWAERFGWRASGERRDEIDGRDAVTVFYEKEGRTIAYTILSGDALDPPSDSARAEREGTTLRYLREEGGRLIVTWERDGRTCVLSGSGVAANKMLDLAGWRGMGGVPF